MSIKSTKSWLYDLVNPSVNQEGNRVLTETAIKKNANEIDVEYVLKRHNSASPVVNYDVTKPHLERILEASTVALGGKGYFCSQNAQKFRRINIASTSSKNVIPRSETTSCYSFNTFSEKESVETKSFDSPERKTQRADFRRISFETDDTTFGEKATRNNVVPECSSSQSQSNTTTDCRKLSLEEANDCYLLNYSMFVQQVASINPRMYTSRPLSQSFRQTSTSKECDFYNVRKHARELTDAGKAESEVIQKKVSTNVLVQLCLQYFDSKQLRIIIMKVKNLKTKRGSVFAKVDLITEKAIQKHKTRKRQVKSNELIFNEEIYFENVDYQDGSDLVLRVRLYKKSRWRLPRSKCIGEMMLSLEEYDLTLYTTLWGVLRPRSAASIHPVFTDINDLEIISVNRSIEAEAAMSVNGCHGFNQSLLASSQQHIRCLPLRRSNSVPLNHRHRVNQIDSQAQ